MTAKQLVDAPALKLAVYALAIGLAWATLKADVSQKADKTEVEAMAADIKDIKAILCAKNTDSFCR